MPCSVTDALRQSTLLKTSQAAWFETSTHTPLTLEGDLLVAVGMLYVVIANPPKTVLGMQVPFMRGLVII